VQEDTGMEGIYVEQIDEDASGDDIAIHIKDKSTDVKTM
jgi:hypothetical protein